MGGPIPERMLAEATKPAPTKAKETKAQPAKAKPTKPAPTKAKATKAQPVKVQPTKPKPTKPRTTKGRALYTVERLAGEYPGTAAELCELAFEGSFQLLVATVLSAQTTDQRVNQVTPALFARYPTPEELGQADPDELEALIRPTGFFRSKARSLIGLGRALAERFDGHVPAEMTDLVTVPGVGRKTANVVRSVGLGLPGLPVDTHVIRVSGRLGLTEATDPVKIETDLCAMVPEAEWGALSLRMILHGRRVCAARRPRCQDCVLADFCPSAHLPVAQAATRRRVSRPPATIVQ